MSIPKYPKFFLLVLCSSSYTSINHLVLTSKILDYSNIIFFAETQYTVTRAEFFDVWRSFPKVTRNTDIYNFLIKKFSLVNVSETQKKQIQNKIKLMSCKLSERWTASSSRIDRFLTLNGKWLQEGQLCLSVIEPKIQISSNPSTSSRGRPIKGFDQCSVKTKRRKVQDLLNTRSTSEIAYAAEVAVRATGKKDAASIIKELSSASPKRASTFKKIRQKDSQQRVLTSDEALAHYVDTKMTTHAYKLTRKRAINVGHYIFPSFHSLKRSKQSCYPPDETIAISETFAEIKLQGILDHTAQRLCKAQEEVFKRLLPGDSYTLVSKWGCDGSSGHSNYKQKFQTVECNDEFLFIISFVPLKIEENNENKTVAWYNPRTSSTRYCRPIKILFSKETSETTQIECEKIKAQIEHLNPTKVYIEGTEIAISHKLLLTMVDGKVCNSLTENKSTQTCYICGATPKQMNSYEARIPINTEYFSFGLSTLHAWIRTFEFFLHISYRINLKKWQIRGVREKELLVTRQNEIKMRFKKEMGLIVDQPKPGCGSTNDGNTARRFFRNYELSADITGVDQILIKKFGIILKAISSGYDIDLEKFEKFATDTKALYLSLYSWYFMSATVHKLLCHGKDIIQSCIVPIGQLSEEAQEARNKDCRRFRERHTRKCSRESTNKDLLSMLLITSDPVINTYRELPRKPASSLDPEVLELLLTPPEPLPIHLPIVSHEAETNDYTVSDFTEYESDSDSSSE